MVKVFPVHHFPSQNICTIEDSCAIAVCSNDRLLVAKKQHTIEVRNLGCDEEHAISHRFPTMGEVHSMKYCPSRNYVLTLETKTVQKEKKQCVRMYTNWDSEFVVNMCKRSELGGELPGIKFRVAGAVEPTIYADSKDYLNITEIPIDLPPDNSLVTCCKDTGSVLLSCRGVLYIFYPVCSKTRDVSHSSYIDFLPLQCTLQLRFCPTLIDIVQNVITASNEEYVYSFVVNADELKHLLNINQKGHSESDMNFEDVETEVTKSNLKNGVIDVNEIIKLAMNGKCEMALNSVLKPTSFPIAVHLPGINDVAMSRRKRSIPIRDDKGVNPLSLKPIGNKSVNSEISTKRLLYLRSTCRADLEDQVTKVGVLPLCTPITDSNETVQEEDCEMSLRACKSVCGLLCFVATYQEGYLYYLPLNECTNVSEEVSCIGMYNFTAPVINIRLESYLLHVLTSVGLETYNLMSNSMLMSPSKQMSIPNSDAVSLFGFHPFIGIIYFMKSENYLSIFTSPDKEKSSSWTVYSLRIPDALTVYKEMMDVANSYKTGHDTMSYEYLSFEATALLHVAYKYDKQIPVSSQEELKELYMKSSLQLAKIRLRSNNSEERNIGLRYYLNSGSDLSDFISEMLSEKIEVYQVDRLMYMIEKWLQINKQNALTTTLIGQLIKLTKLKQDASFLAKIVLKKRSIHTSDGARILRALEEYPLLLDSKDAGPLLALCVLQLKCKDRIDATDNVIHFCETENGKRSFINTLIQHWDILLEKDNEDLSFNDICIFLINAVPEIFSIVLARLTTTKKKLQLEQVVKAVLKHITMHTAANNPYVLTRTLELIFSSKCPPNPDRSHAQNALRILMRSYVNDLHNKSKPEYVVKELTVDDSASSYKMIYSKSLPQFLTLLCNDHRYYPTLNKLQDLICSQMLKEETLKELDEYIREMLPEECKLSVQVLFNFKEPLIKLVEKYPKAVFQFSKFACKTKKNWGYVVTLVWNKCITLCPEPQYESWGRIKVSNGADWYQAIQLILDHLAKFVLNKNDLHDIMTPLFNKKKHYPMYQTYILISQNIERSKLLDEVMKADTRRMLSEFK